MLDDTFLWEGNISDLKISNGKHTYILILISFQQFQHTKLRRLTEQGQLLENKQIFEISNFEISSNLTIPNWLMTCQKHKVFRYFKYVRAWNFLCFNYKNKWGKCFLEIEHWQYTVHRIKQPILKPRILKFHELAIWPRQIK